MLDRPGSTFSLPPLDQQNQSTGPMKRFENSKPTPVKKQKIYNVDTIQLNPKKDTLTLQLLQAEMEKLKAEREAWLEIKLANQAKRIYYDQMSIKAALETKIIAENNNISIQTFQSMTD